MRKPPATATPFTFRWRASPRLYRRRGAIAEFRVGFHERRLFTALPALESSESANVVP